jgi:hypothetical protein
MMRKHLRHGLGHRDNPFIVRSDKHESRIANGWLVVTIHVAKKYGGDIALTKSSSAKGVDLKGCNLRIILNGDVVESRVNELQINPLLNSEQLFMEQISNVRRDNRRTRMGTGHGR